MEASSINFIIMLYLASLGIIIGGAILAFLVGLRLARPIVTLANKVETNDIETILSLSKTKSGYSEIDALLITRLNFAFISSRFAMFSSIEVVLRYMNYAIFRRGINSWSY